MITRVAPATVLLLCAVPPATNVSPGPWGYALILVVLSVLSIWLWTRPAVSAPLGRTEALSGVVLFGWITVSITRAGGLWPEAVVVTVLAGVVASSAYLLATRTAREQLATTVILCCGAAVVGSAVAAWVVPVLTGAGWHLRPGLPLGGSSNSAVGLSLALAGTLVGARRWPTARLLWLVLSLAAAALVVQSASRAAWVMALAVGLAALPMHRQWGWRRVALVAVPVGLVAPFVLLRIRGSGALTYQARWDNTVSGLEAWSGSLGTVLLGVGPLQMWPWLPLERLWAGLGVVGTPLIESPTGAVLYHAHSTCTEALVEYGLIGFTALVVVLALTARRCGREIRQRGNLSLLAVVLLLALPAMLVELYLFRSFVSAFLWWLAVMAVGRGACDEAQREGHDERAGRREDRDRARHPQTGGEDLDAQAQQADDTEGARQIEDLAHGRARTTWGVRPRGDADGQVECCEGAGEEPDAGCQDRGVEVADCGDCRHREEEESGVDEGPEEGAHAWFRGFGRGAASRLDHRGKGRFQ